jgi:hypothetical protein
VACACRLHGVQNVIMDLGQTDNGKFFNYDGAELPF